jgi:hypothetical protein
MSHPLNRREQSQCEYLPIHQVVSPKTAQHSIAHTIIYITKATHSQQTTSKVRKAIPISHFPNLNLGKQLRSKEQISIWAVQSVPFLSIPSHPISLHPSILKKTSQTRFRQGHGSKSDIRCVCLFDWSSHPRAEVTASRKEGWLGQFFPSPAFRALVVVPCSVYCCLLKSQIRPW